MMRLIWSKGKSTEGKVVMGREDDAAAMELAREGVRRRVCLIDGSGFIFRAYHALPPLTRQSDGFPVGAISGFCNMLWKLLQRDDVRNQVTHIGVILDTGRRSFRNDLYPAYKSSRPEPPQELRRQFGVIRRAVEAFSLPVVEMEGFEADDLIATYTARAVRDGGNVRIVSSDKDLMQLVCNGVDMYDAMKDRVIDADAVREKFGVGPEHVVDVQALVGDKTDDIPGVPGIGIKTAAVLVGEYGDLESVLACAQEIPRMKMREKLIEFADQARLSRRLAMLDRDVALEIPLDALVRRTLDRDRLMSFLEEMELRQLSRRVCSLMGGGSSGSVGGGGGARTEECVVPGHREELLCGKDRKAMFEPMDLVRSRLEESCVVERQGYTCVSDPVDLGRWVNRAMAQGWVCVDTETTGLRVVDCDLVGVSLALGPGDACYIPLGHNSALWDECPRQMDLGTVLGILRPMLESPGVLKIGHHVKYDWSVLFRYGITVGPVDDTMLMSYVLDCGKHGHGLDALARAHCGHRMLSFKEVVFPGSGRKSFADVPVEEATAYAAEDADMTLRLYRRLSPRLAAEGMRSVYENLERRLIVPLARMELAGILVDQEVLDSLSSEFSSKLREIEANLEHVAGKAFNPASPRQVGEILFERMGLVGGRKTKTGQWETGSEVLEFLASWGHVLPRLVLEWRRLAKLKSTYTEAIPKHVDGSTGRVHSAFSSAIAITGRLTSSRPNLQNLPVRTEDGRRVRAAFVAAPGCVLVSADYNQVELRILAHFTGIDRLRTAFERGEDIHTTTASEIFSVPVEKVTPDLRRQAKAINFGVIYGISAFGLANQLGVSRERAQRFIVSYFERFPGIVDYMERTKEFCRSHGFVETLFGRRIHYPEIADAPVHRRAFLERAAINAPIQGSAADIMRRAMIHVAEAIEAKGWGARSVLQVHDELVLEVPESEVEVLCPCVKRILEDAAGPVVRLDVPLVVELRVGKDWAQSHREV